MLMAEGFQQSKVLSRKFVILYKLCEDLLSKSQHYDWKLRAIKTTLYVAGGMRRASPEMSEDKVRSPISACARATKQDCPYAACCEAPCLLAHSASPWSHAGAAARSARLQPGQAHRG